MPQTSSATRNGPKPGANPVGETLSDEIAAATNTRKNVPMISLMKFVGAFRIAGEVQKQARLPSASSVSAQCGR